MISRFPPLAGALLSCALYAASFPPLGLFPLAWIALVPLLLTLRQVSPRRGAALGLLWGVGSGAVLASWLPATIAGFFEAGWLLAFGAAALVFLYCALPYAAFGAWLAWTTGRRGAGPLAVAAAWAACELFRVHGVVETPWALIAFTQAPWLTIVQSADLFGAIGLGMLIVAVNASLAGLLVRAPRAFRSACLTACLFVLVWGYGGFRLGQDFGVGEPLRVAVVQGGIESELRLDAARSEQNLEHYLELTREAKRGEPTLVLWPELALQFPFAARPELWQRIAETSRALDLELLVGAPHVRTRLFVRERLNSAFLVRDGRIADRHDKVGLMPFSETRPAGLPIGRDAYLAGLELRPLRSRSGALGVLLCSELLHPGLARRLVSGGAQLLANPSNDDWFSTRAAADHQLAVAVFRAVENRRPVMRPSTNGRAAIIDAHGRMLAVAPYREPAVLEARLRRSDEDTVYARLGGLSPAPIASGLVLASVFHLAVVWRRTS